MLEVKKLNKSYYTKNNKYLVNNNISFSVNNGSLVWIKGNSGAGKSTLLNVISGIDVFDSGEILWDDYRIENKTPNELAKFRNENCGLIFQFFELLKTQTALENVFLPLKISNNVNEKNKKDAIDLFDQFRIKELINKKPSELSGGEKQRVGIIRALINSPKFIIADEITASLDEKMSRIVYEYIHKYIKTKNGIGVFVSHDTIIGNYVDDIYEMQNGELTKCI
jgi:putative ABC transport system ATP-binding protein